MPEFANTPMQQAMLDALVADLDKFSNGSSSPAVLKVFNRKRKKYIEALKSSRQAKVGTGYVRFGDRAVVQRLGGGK